MFGYKQCKKQQKSCQNVGVCHIHISISCQRITKSGTYPLKTKETTFSFQLSVKYG